MFSTLSDLYDDTVVYIRNNKSKLAKHNIRTLQNVIRITAVMYLVMYVVFFSRGFSPSPVHIMLPAVLFFVWKISRFFGERVQEDFKKSRLVAAGCYGLLVVSLILFDAIAFSAQRSVLFAIALMALSSVYVDDFFVLLLEKLAFTGCYIVAEWMCKQREFLRGDIYIGLAAFVISMCCYAFMLSMQADQDTVGRILEEKGSTDLLTGLYNKLSFEEQTRDYIAGRGPGEPCALLIIDFDNFKHVNDNYGHLVGDQILKKFGQILHSNFRVSDIVGRVGGDEFMVLVSGGMPPGELERKCENVEHELVTSRIGEAKGFSCSIGVVTDEEDFTFEELYLLADDALYEAKARGKKQFVKWSSRRVVPPEKKIIYIASPDQRLLPRVQKAYGDKYVYMQEGKATVALNEISLYQKYIDNVLFDYRNLDMDESILRLYINSRPIFAKVPVCDVWKEL